MERARGNAGFRFKACDHDLANRLAGIGRRVPVRAVKVPGVGVLCCAKGVG